MKLIQRYKGWKIYTGYSDYTYSAFLPHEGPSTCDSPEWEDDNIVCLREFIDCY